MTRIARTLSQLLALATLAAAAPALADSVMVHLHHGSVDPAEVKVAAGDTVVFHNLDEMPGGHTVAADDGSFESPALPKDGQWSHVFDAAGRHGFHLKEHPDTKGVVVVE